MGLPKFKLQVMVSIRLPRVVYCIINPQFTEVAETAEYFLVIKLQVICNA